MLCLFSFCVPIHVGISVELKDIILFKFAVRELLKTGTLSFITSENVFCSLCIVPVMTFMLMFMSLNCAGFQVSLHKSTQTDAKCLHQ